MDAPKVALNGAAGKGGHAKAMPRVASNARLAEQGGTRVQLLGRCATKAAMLGGIVYLLTAPGVQLPRLAQELLYGAPTAQGFTQHKNHKIPQILFTCSWRWASAAPGAGAAVQCAACPGFYQASQCSSA